MKDLVKLLAFLDTNNINYRQLNFIKSIGEQDANNSN
jgi:hypothetical protein